MPTSRELPPNVPPPPVAAPPAPADGEDEGMLDLDDHDAINNQHLEVR